MIRYERFTKRYGSLTAVDDLTIEVASGTTFGLIGPNGSGKTTILKALVGLLRPTSGRISVGGLDATFGGPDARALIGYLPQRLSFPEGLTAREVMELYVKLRGASRDEIDPLLERVSLSASSQRNPDHFSGGMRQRLGLAVAQLGRPPVIVLDEPSAALDPTGSLLVRDIIRGIRADGTTVLISSHDLAEVAALADSIALFTAGRLRAAGPLSELEAAAGGAGGIENVYRALAAGSAEAA